MTDVSNSPSVGIVTVNYNSSRFIGEFVESICKVDYPSTKLVVVDAGSSDGSADEIERLCPHAHIIRSGENVGIARGNNIGARYCLEQGLDYVLFVNNDTTHQPDLLRLLVEAADGRTMTVPRILFAHDHALINTHAGDFDWTLGVFRNTYHGKRDGPRTRLPRELQTASFCCVLVPAKAFDDVGPLDERFFMYYEETDFLRRALERGYRLRYVPDAVVYHQESASSGGGWMTPFKQYYATRNRLYLLRKHQPSRLRYAVFTLYFWLTRIPSFVPFALRGRWPLMRAQMLGMKHYYQGRMGRTMEVQDF